MVQKHVALVCLLVLASCADNYTERHPNGSVSLECERYDNGCRGAFKRYDPDGHLIETGSRDDQGLLTGERVGYFTSGDTEYVSHYRGGTLDGEVRMFLHDNHIDAIGQFMNGKPVGKRISYYPSGKIRIEEEVPTDTATTRFVEYYESGNIKFSALRRGGATIYYESRDTLGIIVERFPNIPNP